MSGFANAAKALISQTTTAISPHQPLARSAGTTAEKLDNLKLLTESGFSPREVLRDLRELYDSCETDEKTIRLQISKLMIQVLGMMSTEDQTRQTPTIVFNIQGDHARINTMLCPLAPA